MTRDEIEAFIEGELPDQDVLLADGLDEAFLGLASDDDPPVAVYSIQKSIEIFKSQGMNRAEAWENFQINVQRALGSEDYPLFIDTPED